MYRNIKIRIVVIALLSIVVTIAISNYLSKMTSRSEVIIASRDIPARSIISDHDIKVIMINDQDKKKLYTNSYLQKSDIIGKVVENTIHSNDIIVARDLVDDSEQKSIIASEGVVKQSYFISEDSRVIGVEVDASGSLNYKLNRGDYVDVIFTSDNDLTGGLYSRVLAQHLKIFDIQGIVTSDNGVIQKRQNILLEATPEQCLTITVAKRNGIIDFLLNPLKGDVGEDVAPVNLLSFKVSTPLSKAEKLDRLWKYVANMEISNITKDKMLTAINEERGIDAILDVIMGTDIALEMKYELMKILE